MCKEQYTIGVDYGSLSARGVLVRVRDGEIAAEAEFAYPHGIITGALPDGTPLPGDWFLEHPQDYLDAMSFIVPRLRAQSGIPAAQIVGLAIDFTCSTMVPLDKQGQALCLNEAYASRPHAWVKLWKHHGAKPQAEALQRVSEAQGRPYPDWYGGVISQETLTAKVLEVFAQDRAVYDAADAFVDAGDYVTSQLAGEMCFSLPMAAAKAFWCKESGYPDAAFFGAIDPALADMPQQKLMAHFPNAKRGYPGQGVAKLCAAWAERLGLCPGIALCPAQLDAYAALPGLGVTGPGEALMVVGTSMALLTMQTDRVLVPGVTACLPDTFYPGMWCYACGQSSLGDIFQWFVENYVPADYVQAAKERGMSVHAYLTELARKMEPGDSGLVALDWFNGNRSCLANPRLSGMLLGLGLQTRPEEIYRALLEAVVFGARSIFDTFAASGAPIEEVVLCGGIPMKNTLLNQMYADILRRPIRVSACKQAPALGSAINAAAAAGVMPLSEAIARMHDGAFHVYTTDEARAARYDLLYAEYARLSDYFGRGENRVMERLLAMRAAGKERKRGR